MINYTSRILCICILCVSTVLLSGCSLSSLKGSISDKLDSIIKKDQQHEQGFVLTKKSLYEAFDKEAKMIDLSEKSLTAIPELCDLLDEEDYKLVRWLDLSNNAIRLVNTDLSCLTYLRSLDLSHNSIQAVQTVGSLPALRELNMEHNDLTTTENFPDFPMLEKLYLAYNELKEVKDLEHLKNLVLLELQNNLIEQVIGLEKLEQLKQLRMDYDKIKSGDLTPLLDKLEELELLDSLGNTLGNALREKLREGFPL